MHSVSGQGCLLQVVKTQAFDSAYWRSRFLANTRESEPDTLLQAEESTEAAALPHRRAVTVPPTTTKGKDTPTCSPISCDGLPAHVRPTFQLLWRLASEVMAYRNQYRATVMVFHVPQELIAAHLGIHPVTLWRHLNVLEEHGYVAVKAHYTTSKATTRVDGTVFAVAMKAGQKATLRHHDLVYQYRDLDADRETGRTAWKLMQGSGKDIQGDKGFLLLRDWVVGIFQINPVESDPCTDNMSTIGAIEQLETLHPTEQPAAITKVASALARLLHDSQSKRFYAALLWKALRASCCGGRPLRVLANCVTRVLADLNEGFARRAGALLLTRLREGGWLDAVTALSSSSSRLL